MLSQLKALVESCSCEELNEIKLLIDKRLQINFIVKIPPEISDLILIHLPLAELNICLTVSKEWYHFIKASKTLWSHKLKSDHPSFIPNDYSISDYKEIHLEWTRWNELWLSPPSVTNLNPLKSNVTPGFIGIHSWSFLSLINESAFSRIMFL